MLLNAPIVRYSSLVFALLAGFANFVACGARMYKISLEDDFNLPPNRQGPMAGAASDYGIHTLEGWGNQIPIPFRFSYELDPEMRQHLLRAMTTWETAVGKKLFHNLAGAHNKTGDDFPDLYSSLDDNINGHYINDEWQKTGKSQDVIATTIWDSGFDANDHTSVLITSADIRFNFQHYNIGDSFTLLENDARSVVDMESLALHELGHLLGLSHIPDEDDPLSIMNPALLIGEGLASRKISRGDIERIQRIYGCEGIACDIGTIYHQLETGTAQPLAQTTIPSSTTSTPTIAAPPSIHQPADSRAQSASDQDADTTQSQ